MTIAITDTYEELSAKAADYIITPVHSKKQPLICTASGDSPAGLYKELQPANWTFEIGVLWGYYDDQKSNS